MSDPPQPARRIDVHAHFLPPGYRQACVDAGHAMPDGFPLPPDWSTEAVLELMDGVGVNVSLLSISSPGVYFGDRDAARSLARSVNIAGSEIVRAHPQRFGLMASLPLPDVDDALAELANAYEDLACEGIVLLTNYAGKYLCAGGYEPLFAELDRSSWPTC